MASPLQSQPAHHHPAGAGAPLAEVVRWVATLGGYLGRKADGPAGGTVRWRGFQALAQRTARYQVFRPPTPPWRTVGND
jgi:hypothetical protein